MQTVTTLTKENILKKVDKYFIDKGNSYMAYTRFGVGCPPDKSSDIILNRMVKVLNQNLCQYDKYTDAILETINNIIIKNG